MAHSFIHHLERVQKTYQEDLDQLIKELNDEYQQFVLHANVKKDDNHNATSTKQNLKKDFKYLKSAIINMFEECMTNHDLLLDNKCFENNTLTFYEFFTTKLFVQDNNNNDHDIANKEITKLVNNRGDLEKFKTIKNIIDAIKNERDDSNSNISQRQQEKKNVSCWPSQEKESQLNVNSMFQIYNGDKYCTRLSMNNYIHSICDCLKFYYHIDKGVHIQLLIENNEGYIKISNLSSSVLQNNATIEQLIFKKLLSNNSTINNSSNNGNNNFSIGGGSSLVDIYVLDSNFTAKETVDIDLAYKNHAYKIHQLKIPNINANLRIVREIIYGITLKNDEGDGSGGNKDPGDDSSSDEDSENDDNDFDYDDDLHHRKNHAEIIKYKFQIFSKLNQKETYHFSHQGINIEQDQEIHTGAIEVAIDEGCLETYNGVVQSEELILLINDE